MSRLLACAGRLIDRIKINDVSRQARSEGTVFWVKRRQLHSPLLIPVANWFFSIVGNPIRILADRREWHRWERECMELLHAGRFRVESHADGALCTEEMPGISVSSHLNAGTVTAPMFIAVAREFRRAHELTSPAFQGAAWSHGDPHSGNFIYDEQTGAALLMDFEVQHDPTLPQLRRHTDDLLVFLQDTLGRMPRERWLELARTFVRTYDRPEVTTCLLERLTAPTGIARIWWAVRTTYTAEKELAGRLHALREALAA